MILAKARGCLSPWTGAGITLSSSRGKMRYKWWGRAGRRYGKLWRSLVTYMRREADGTDITMMRVAEWLQTWMEYGSSPLINANFFKKSQVSHSEQHPSPLSNLA